ncbi:MAG TPA: hypothetical protein VER17_11110 [Tepidisphaeraceae bacterium]|nr:hypothetical protein [Tepidisphaeraceae bacterium]
MNSRPSSPDVGGYSPDISADLVLDGIPHPLASFGPFGLALKTPCDAVAGIGTINLVVDRQLTTFLVELPDGLNRSRDLQPFRVLQVSEHAA